MNIQTINTLIAIVSVVLAFFAVFNLNNAYKLNLTKGHSVSFLLSFIFITAFLAFGFQMLLGVDEHEITITYIISYILTAIFCFILVIIVYQLEKYLAILLKWILSRSALTTRLTKNFQVLLGICIVGLFFLAWLLHITFKLFINTSGIVSYLYLGISLVLCLLELHLIVAIYKKVRG